LKMPIHSHFFGGRLTCKVGQTDLVFGVRSEFINWSVMNARVQVSLCSAVTICADCATLVNIQIQTENTDRQQFDQLI